MVTKTERFAVRLTAEQDALIRRAAEVEGTNLTNFTVTATLAHARDVLADRRWRPAEVFREFLDDMNEFRQTPEARRLRAAQQVGEADLRSWLADQPGVMVHSHGGDAPEQWKGEVDGHSFYFRERDTEWEIEIDLRPSGSMRVVDGTDDDGTPRYRQHEIIEGDVIATGTTAARGYGDSPRERAAFIVATIRDHLRR